MDDMEYVEEEYLFLLFIFEFNREKVWAKIYQPCLYEDFVQKACELFPSLNGIEFKITDVNGARLDPDFLVEFVENSQRGVILKIVSTENESEISNTQLSTPPLTGLTKAGCSFSRDEEEVVPSVSKKVRIGIDDDSCRVLSQEKLLRLLKDSSCGEDIILDYENNKFLTEKYRKLLITIIVEHLLKHKKQVNRQLLSSEKSQCAQAIIDLFPNLRNNQSNLGYEHFYDPAKGTGYIASKLSNARRSVSKSSKTTRKQKPSNQKEVVQPADESDTIKDAILFMKSATPAQKTAIIEKTIQTHKFRRLMYLNVNFFDEFPRFLDTPELIDVEFELLFPMQDSNNFVNLFPEFVNPIWTVFTSEKSLNTIQEWDRTTKSILALTQLIPPTAKGKKAAGRGKKQNVIKKLIVFKESGTSLKSNEENRNQPKLIAIGPNRIVIEQYFLEIDKKFISLPTTNVIKALDFLFKAHYVFNTEFDNDLQSFWVFLQHYFYKIPSKCTNTAVEIFTKINVIKENTVTTVDELTASENEDT